MPFSYLRIGSLAEVRLAESNSSFDYGRRVIVRTERGVELAEIMRPAMGLSAKVPTAAILRGTTEEDELLIRRLNRHKREAVEACREALAESGSTSVLLDVDQLFDGGTLVMHFLGPVDEIAESVTQRVSERYEAIVRSRHFAKLLVDGCGPSCGEKEGGCEGSCAGCAVAEKCRTV